MPKIVPFSQKILFDTSIYISELRAQSYSHKIESHIRHHSLYLSSVVYLELRAGVSKPKDVRELEKLKKAFESKNRLLTPSSSDWAKGGEILSKIYQKQPRHRSKITSLINDLLIILSARGQGITVVTENKKDFELIKNLYPFSLEIWKHN